MVTVRCKIQLVEIILFFTEANCSSCENNRNSYGPGLKSEHIATIEFERPNSIIAIQQLNGCVLFGEAMRVLYDATHQHDRQHDQHGRTATGTWTSRTCHVVASHTSHCHTATSTVTK